MQLTRRVNINFSTSASVLESLSTIIFLKYEQKNYVIQKGFNCRTFLLCYTLMFATHFRPLSHLHICIRDPLRGQYDCIFHRPSQPQDLERKSVQIK